MGVLSRGRRFSELDPARVGLVAVVVVALLLATVLNVGRIADALTGTSYSAVFTEAGGLHSGDPVKVSGVPVGKVHSIEIVGNTIKVEFSSERELGDRTRLAIKSDTLLGAKFLAIDSRGSSALEPGSEIPLGRTSAPYDLTTALADFTKSSDSIATDQLATALDTLSAAFANTPESVRGVLDGTKRLANVVAARDEELAALLADAEGVSSVLAKRNVDLVTIISDGSLLLESLQARRTEIGRLFRALTRVTGELSGFARENRKELAPTLATLQRSLKVINKNMDNLDDTISGFSGFSRSLLEGLGGGAFFYGYAGGVAPANMRPVLDGLLADLLPHQEGQP